MPALALANGAEKLPTDPLITRTQTGGTTLTRSKGGKWTASHRFTYGHPYIPVPNARQCSWISKRARATLVLVEKGNLTPNCHTSWSVLALLILLCWYCCVGNAVGTAVLVLLVLLCWHCWYCYVGTIGMAVLAECVVGTIVFAAFTYYECNCRHN